MINQRTLLKPGEGIIPPEEPIKEHKRYPLVMTHPGFQPGIPDKEIRIMNEQTGKWTGYLKYEGGRPIRYAPVLVHTEADEGSHAAQGYVPGQTCTADQFAKYVQNAAPPIENYEPIEYPKWVNGRVANNAEEEAEILGVIAEATGSSEVPADAPSLSAEVNARDTDTVFLLEAGRNLLSEETKEERIARLKRELAEAEDAADEDDTARQEEARTARRQADLDASARQAAAQGDTAGDQFDGPTEAAKRRAADEALKVAAAAEAKRKARSDAIKAELARKKGAQAGDRA